MPGKSSECAGPREGLRQRGAYVVYGGTDNHLILIDVRPLGLTGRQGAGALRECGITSNSNSLPL